MIKISQLHDLILQKYGLDISVAQIFRYISEGILPFEKIGGHWALNEDFLAAAERVFLLRFVGFGRKEVKNLSDEKVKERLGTILKVVKILRRGKRLPR